MNASTVLAQRDFPSVAVIGGGVIGLAIGWRLAAAGCAVDVFDKGAAGRGSSWAAAGMLAAGLETEPGGESLLALALRSQALWPDFARELAASSGIDVGYRDEGTLAVALTRDDAERLRFTVAFQQRLGIAIQWLSGDAARAPEPHLRPTLAAPALHRGDH